MSEPAVRPAMSINTIMLPARWMSSMLSNRLAYFIWITVVIQPFENATRISKRKTSSSTRISGLVIYPPLLSSLYYGKAIASMMKKITREIERYKHVLRDGLRNILSLVAILPT